MWETVGAGKSNLKTFISQRSQLSVSQQLRLVLISFPFPPVMGWDRTGQTSNKPGPDVHRTDLLSLECYNHLLSAEMASLKLVGVWTDKAAREAG